MKGGIKKYKRKVKNGEKQMRFFPFKVEKMGVKRIETGVEKAGKMM